MERISIIIPTRERCDTLKYTLKTCLIQDDGNLDIIVSDNFSQDATKGVVQSFSDKRIQYINPGKRLSMSHHWEFALSHVDDGFVLFLGDDDGLLPNSILNLRTIIKSTRMKAIAWAQASYSWPTHIHPDESNQLFIPLSKKFEVRSTEKYLTDVAGFNINYLELPGLYKGLVHYDLIEKARSKNGLFFNSNQPDLYSGVAIANTTSNYYYSHEPFTINGASHHSGGTSYFSNSDDEKNKANAKKFLEEDNIPFHHQLVLAPSIPILITESVLQANEHLMHGNKILIDFTLLLRKAIEAAIPMSSSNYKAVASAVREIAMLNRVDKQYVEKIIAQHKNISASEYKPNFGFDLLHTGVRLDCKELNINNVYEASIACGCVLKLESFKHASISSMQRTIQQILKSMPGYLFRRISRVF